MDRLKYFQSEFNTQGRRGENDDVTAFGRWAAVNNSFPEHISESSFVLVRLSSNFTHDTPRGSSCAFWGI